MAKLKIEIGKFYLTRNGDKAFVDANTSKESTSIHPFVGRIKLAKRNMDCAWNESGLFDSDSKFPSGLDLISEWKEESAEVDKLKKLQNFYNKMAEVQFELYEKFKGTGQMVSDSGLLASDFYYGKHAAYEHCADEVSMILSK